MKLLVQRRGNVLVPLSDYGRKAITRMADGDSVIVSVNFGRSAKQNALYHSIIDRVAEATGYDSPEKLHNQIKEALGYYDLLETLEGNTVKIMRSTSFDDMPPDEFRAFFDRAIDLICRDLLPHLSKDDLAVEIQAMLGG